MPMRGARASRWWRLRGQAGASRCADCICGARSDAARRFSSTCCSSPSQCERKLRLHFHRFMGRVHAELRKLEGRDDPLRDVAAHFAEQARVLCLDEFFVTDIGDAMILAGLLQHLFERGTTLVTTSNIEPEQLYRDGLQRARFLPAIALLERQCSVVELLAAQDYRLRELSRAGVYFTPPGAAAERALEACFEHVAPGALRPEPEIVVNGRGIAVKRRAEGVIWFDFDALCEGPRSVADYIELAQSFNTVLISGVPQFSPQMEDAARRFVNLVDEFYDRGVNLVLSGGRADRRSLRRRAPARRIRAHAVAPDRNAECRIPGARAPALGAPRHGRTECVVRPLLLESGHGRPQKSEQRTTFCPSP